ncbi:adenylosuccinate lyase [Candidatus Kaiserbacteria bacterium]|nr:adenylosuccinate lyase [Candidatus Kaiserbacteria bacterium]
MTRDIYDSLSPSDYRYWDEDVAQYLSENAYTRYKLAVELALVRALAKRKMCSPAVVKEVEAACEQVTTAEVYEEEGRIKHDVRALVNCIRAKVSDEAKPFVHMTATSQDIIDSANAARWKDATEKVLVPALVELEKTLIEIAEREAETVQVGRTHGQHAVPITFGFAVSSYVSRLGQSIEAIKALAPELRGKFAGAVGAYNASSLFFDDPEQFEKDVLGELGIEPSEQSSQVAPAEPLLRLLAEITIASGIMANLADDMRHLQRTEIGEVGEEFEAAQVGSSTMPQKRNPINFENAKSLWKTIVPRILTAFMDQISEHQRDLTNSASARTYGETLAYAVSMAKRLNRAMSKIKVDTERLRLNLNLQVGLIAAEPLYIMLAALGHPDAHEAVRNLTLQAQKESKPLEEIALADADLAPYIAKMSADQKKILSNPSLYVGIASKKASATAKKWKKKFA